MTLEQVYSSTRVSYGLEWFTIVLHDETISVKVLKEYSDKAWKWSIQQLCTVLNSTTNLGWAIWYGLPRIESNGWYHKTFCTW